MKLHGLLLTFCVSFLGASDRITYVCHDNSFRKQIFVLIDLRKQTQINDWDIVHECMFEIPALILSMDKNIERVLILVPDQLHTVGVLDQHAPFLESVRTFLSIVRAYAATGQLSGVWQIIPCSDDDSDITSADFLHKLISVQKRQSILNTLSVAAFGECALSDGSFNILCDGDTVGTIQEKQFTVFEYPWQSIESGKKRWCISGGAGFIGRHLTERLLAQGDQVIVLDNFTCSERESIKIFEDNVSFACIDHDVSVPFAITGHIDGVIHLASIPSPADYYKMPLETLKAGLEGTEHMLMLAQEKGARFIFASTSEVYGDPEMPIQSEEYAGNVNYLGPRSQYDQSKRGAEVLARLYYEQHGIDVRIARIFNTYGPGMRLHDGRVITNFIAAALEQTPITMYGSGNQTRSFGYVDDTVEGLKLLLEANPETFSTFKSRIFNIGTPEEFSIAELAEKVTELSVQYLDRVPVITRIENPDSTDPRQRRPNIQKAQSILRFNPTISLDEGLKKTFLHFMRYH